MNASDRDPPRDDRSGPNEFDLLAPWKTTERLDDDDAEIFDRLLADDPALARRLDAAMEEREAAVDVNEALPTLSRAAMDRLFDRIETHEAERSGSPYGALHWLLSKLTGFQPTTIALGAAAAALVIALQAGLLTRSYVTNSYQTASDGTSIDDPGTTALITFQPTATAEQIATALRNAHAEIVAGPKPGGVFVVRLSDARLSSEQLDAAMKPLKDARGVVKLVAPGR